MAERKVVKKVKNGVLYSDGCIRVDGGRCSYPHIGTPVENERDNGTKVKNFGTDLLCPKKTHSEVATLIEQEIEKLLKAADGKVVRKNWFLKDGDELADEAEQNGEDREVLRGNWVIRTSDTRRPNARDKDATSLTPEEADDEFYGGMWANILIRPWYFNGKGKDGKTYPKRVSANFFSIQKVRDDEAFGNGRVDDDGVFGSVDEDEDDPL